MSIETPHREPLTLVTKGEQTPEEQGAASEARKLVMEAMRHLADAQLDRAERVRLSGRQTFAYVSGFFAIAQVITFTAFAKAEVSLFEQNWIVRVALAATVSLAITGLLAIWTDRLRKVPDIAGKDILKQADKAEADGIHVAERLTKLYLDAAEGRSNAAKTRRFLMGATTLMAIVTVAATLAEIVISLAYRLP